MENPVINNRQSSVSSKATGFLKDIFKAETRNLVRLAILGFGFLVLVILLCSLTPWLLRTFTGQVSNNVKDSLPWSEDNKEEKQKLKTPFTVGNPVVVGKIEWRVQEAKSIEKSSLSQEKKSSENCKTREGYTLVYTKFTIKNLDRAFVTIPRSAIVLVDSKLEAYSIDANKTFSCLGDQKYSLKDKYAVDVLKLDETATLEYLYETPKGAKDLKLKAGDLSTVGKEFEYIDLGI